jgi:hypothetical protein
VTAATMLLERAMRQMSASVPSRIDATTDAARLLENQSSEEVREPQLVALVGPAGISDQP